LAGNTYAPTVGAETKTVVTALQRIANEFSHRERKVPMSAPVFKSNAMARFSAVKYDRFAED
jgi:hypothetical protein